MKSTVVCPWCCTRQPVEKLADDRCCSNPHCQSTFSYNLNVKSPLERGVSQTGGICNPPRSYADVRRRIDFRRAGVAFLFALVFLCGSCAPDKQGHEPLGVEIIMCPPPPGGDTLIAVNVLDTAAAINIPLSKGEPR